MTKSHPHAAKGSLLLAVFLFDALVGGCSVLRMYEPVKIKPTDWVQYGGNVGRTNVAHDDVKPPLVSVWEYDANAGFGNYSGAVADSLIFVGTLQGELHVVRIGTGRRVGSMDFGAAIVGTPVVAGELVYVALTRTAESLVAFNLQNGASEWRANVGDIETSPLLIENQLYVTTVQGELVCVQRYSGNVVWRFSLPVNARFKGIRSSPASDGELIYFGADDGKIYAVRREDGKLRWMFTTGGSVLATPSIQDGRLYVGSTDNVYYCLDTAEGALVWKRNLGSRVYGSQAVDGEQVYVGSADGTIHCLDRGSGETRWAFRAMSVSSTPYVSGGIVFVGALDRRLYALDTVTGQLVWSREFPSRMRASVVVWKNFMVVLLEDRTIVLLKSQEQPS